MPKNRGTVQAPRGKVQATVGQITEILGLLAQSIPKNLTLEAAQKVIGSKSKLINVIRQAFREIIGGILPYADEEIASNYGYPDGFHTRTVQEQAEILLEHFPKLDVSHVQELSSGEFPEWCEGWGVIPDYRLVAKLHPEFEETLTNEQKYCLAFEVALGKLKEKREFKNWREGALTEKHLRLNKKAAQAYSRLNEQLGDCRVFPFQFGKKWRGHSVRNSQVRFEESEFGLGPYEVAILLLTHPDRITGPEQLYVDCAGCEYFPDANAGGGGFGACLYFVWNDHYKLLVLHSYSTGNGGKQWGAVSGCLAQ